MSSWIDEKSRKLCGGSLCCKGEHFTLECSAEDIARGIRAGLARAAEICGERALHGGSLEVAAQAIRGLLK